MTDDGRDMRDFLQAESEHAPAGGPIPARTFRSARLHRAALVVSTLVTATLLIGVAAIALHGNGPDGKPDIGVVGTPSPSIELTPEPEKTKKEGTLADLDLELGLVGTRVRSGDEIKSLLLVVNVSGRTVVEPECRLTAVNFGLIPAGAPDSHLYSHMTVDCGGPSRFPDNFVSARPGPRFDATDVAGDPLPPGEYVAAMEIGGVPGRLTANVEVVGPSAAVEDPVPPDDGRHFVYIDSVSTRSSLPPASVTLSVDSARFLTGPLAQAAAQEAGDVSPGEPVSNGYFISNPDGDLTEVALSDNAKIVLSTWKMSNGPSPEVVDVATFVRILTEPKKSEVGVARSGFWITIKGGLATEVEEQYVP
jgi:hypothetical protein